MIAITRRSRDYALLVASLLFLSLSHAKADTVLVSPSQDAVLVEHPAGELADGSGGNLRVGRTGQGQNSLRRALLSFDVARALPEGAVVTSVRLRMTLAPNSNPETEIRVHRLLADWSEGNSAAPDQGGGGVPAQDGDATWIHRTRPDVDWTSPGGDFDAAIQSATMVDGAGEYAWASTAMADDVQSWAEMPSGNFGWILIGDESQPQTAKRFASRENPDVNLRPVLEIEFAPPPKVPALSSWGVAILALIFLVISSVLLRQRSTVNGA